MKVIAGTLPGNSSACLVRRAFALALAVQVLAPAPGPAQDTRPVDLERYLTARTRLGHFSGAVAVVEDGAVLYRGSFGLADREHRVPTTLDTRYRVASLTKQFTAAAVLLLQEDGLLTVADPIRMHLPELPEAWSRVTVHSLLRHTSGVPDYEEWFGGYASPEYSDFMSQREAPTGIIERAAQMPLDFAPGTAFRYSNTGYLVLGALIERLAGMGFEEFLQLRIFDPLGMKSTQHDNSEAILLHRARGYALARGAFDSAFWNGTTFYRLANYQFMQPPQADAGVISTVDDLVKWDAALTRGALLSTESLQAMFRPGGDGYGYGWYVEEGPYGTVQRHGGGLPGFASEIVRFADAGVTIIVLSNLQTLVPWVRRDIAAIVFGEPWTLPVARQVVSFDSAKHAGNEGTYVTPDGDTLEVFVDDALLVRWPGHFTSVLVPETDGRFYAGLIEGEAEFTRLENGDAALVLRDRFGVALAQAVRVAPGSAGRAQMGARTLRSASRAASRRMGMLWSRSPSGRMPGMSRVVRWASAS